MIEYITYKRETQSKKKYRADTTNIIDNVAAIIRPLFVNHDQSTGLFRMHRGYDPSFIYQ